MEPEMTYLPKPSESTFALPPEGSVKAVCYRVIDLGTQDTTYKGEPKKAHKVLISWEIQDEEAVMEDGRPMSIHQQYTWSMHEKSRLRQDLESWRGKRFAESDLGPGGFNVKDLLGKPCFLGIIHKKSERDGNTYANISAISKLPKGMEATPPVNKLVYSWLSPELFDRQAFSELSDRMQEKIKSSPEYKHLVNGTPEHVIEADHTPFNDDIPF